MLHVTNGESVSIRDTGLPGEVLFWNDVLCEGPVPRGLSLRELSRVRERFIAEYFGLPAAEVSFRPRDESIERFREHEEVVLWFEHDLFDQLQLIQLLDWFSQQDLGAVRLALISSDRYLGPLPADQLAPLFETRQDVSAAEMKLARRAWSAYCSPEPLELAALLETDTSALPFLRGAILRHLQQFPATRNGLARTERQLLQSVTAGLHSFGELFLADQKMEESIFMGDTTLRQYLRGLASARHPLLVAGNGKYEITDFGSAVLEGKEDHVRTNGINRWLGGVHLCEGAPVWRWDEERRAIRP